MLFLRNKKKLKNKNFKEKEHQLGTNRVKKYKFKINKRIYLLIKNKNIIYS